jgi:hypothetical protein
MQRTAPARNTEIAGEDRVTRLPIADWLKTLEEMAVQTAAWLEQVEQALHQPAPGNAKDSIQEAASDAPLTHPSKEGINPLAVNGKAHEPPSPAAQFCLPPSPDWETLLEPAAQSVQSADRGAETVQHLCQQWQERYAAWQQLLKQSLKALLSRSPPP